MSEKDNIFYYRAIPEEGIPFCANVDFYINKLLQYFARKLPLPPKMRVVLQKMRGVRFRDSQCVFIGEDVMFDEVFPRLISVGRNVMITEGAMILTHVYDPSFASHAMRVREITIEDDVFVGARSIIMNGVSLGQGCVVGAGSIVTKDVPARAIVAGIPARQIGSRGSKDASIHAGLTDSLAAFSIK